jgi:hypothetical protein
MFELTAPDEQVAHVVPAAFAPQQRAPLPRFAERRRE